jgi:hypothetical protein
VIAPSESRIMLLILSRLHLLPASFFWRANTGVASAPGGRTIRFGVPGQADILGVYLGRFIAIEVKRPGQKQSPAQTEFQTAINRAGGIYIVATDLETAMAPLRQLTLGGT